MLVRLQKYMADSGICSRRKAEELIKNGRVRVDGEAVTKMGVKIEPGVNSVELDGSLVEPSGEKLYIALNKPIGYITSADDQFGRPAVLDLLKNVDARVFPVGRLDYNSSGLLFLTNDGDFAYRLTHPKHNIEKVYLVKVEGVPDDNKLTTLREGVPLEDGITSPAGVWFVDDDKKTPSLMVTVTEGRNRLVRRMFSAVGHEVLSLHRVSVGGVCIDGLPFGEYRFLSGEEIGVLMTGD